MHIVAIGEILWDLFEAEEHLGGAPFNFAAHAARLGHQVEMLSAVAADERGQRAKTRAGELGVSTRLIQTVDAPATGTVSVHLDHQGQPDYAIQRPAAYDAIELPVEEIARFQADPPDWVYFGTLLQTAPRARQATRRLLDAAPTSQRLYDVNLRKDSYDKSLLAELLPLATVLKVNADEAADLQRMFGDAASGPRAFAQQYASRYGYRGVCITLGAEGCFVLWDGTEGHAPGRRVRIRDAVGAGDAFAAAFLHGVSNEWPIEKTADFANRVGALVASRRGAVPDWTPDQAWALS